MLLSCYLGNINKERNSLSMLNIIGLSKGEDMIDEAIHGNGMIDL